MAEYIERETFLKDIEDRYCLPCKEAGRDHNGCNCRACWVDDMCGEVIDAPAADVAPVVRCKDCKYYCQEKINGVICRHPALDFDTECFDHWINTNPDDFCSYGDRKEGESESTL